MRPLLFLLTVILAGACNDRSPNGWPSNTSAAIWHTRDSTVQFHTYTSAGQLDSTFKTVYLFRDGKVVLDIRMLITRQYDNKGKLIEEQSFHHLDTSNTWAPDGRNTKKYDPKGNLIFDIAFDIKNAKGTISSLKKRIFNLHNQEIIRFEIHQQLELHPEWNIDSALAHEEDEKTSKYDTSIISSSYDENGNCVTETYGRPGAPIGEVLSSIYTQGLKRMTYGMNANGDTNIIYSYDKEGSLTRKTTEYKKMVPYHDIDTTWYEGDRKVKWVSYNNQSHRRKMSVYQYDAKGNEIREINYD